MRELSRSDLDWAEEQPEAFDAASFVDRHSAFDGSFRTHRDLRIEGELKGTISCDGTLFVAEGANVSATIDAEHVTVAGDLSGEIRCRGRLQILPSGRVHAQVSTSSLVIQEGAIYEGQLEMAGLERSAPRPLRARIANTPTSIDSGSQDQSTGNGTTFIRRFGGSEAPWEAQHQDDEAPGSNQIVGPDDPAG